jgi:hypothetical protein
MSELERHTTLGWVAPKNRPAAKECQLLGLLDFDGSKFKLTVRGLYVRNRTASEVLVTD